MKVKGRVCNQCVISIFHFNEATDFAVFQSILLQVFLKQSLLLWMCTWSGFLTLHFAHLTMVIVISFFPLRL